MGNSTSFRSHGALSTAAKVVDSNGTIEEFMYSVRAEELMQENPGQFVCDSSNLQVGCRVPGLAADQELQQQRLYFILPMDLLFSVLTEEEMAWLSRRASGAEIVRKRRKRSIKKKKSFGRKRILPGLGDLCLFPTAAAAVQEDVVAAERSLKGAMGGEHILRRLRSWEPALDTIEEEGLKL